MTISLQTCCLLRAIVATSLLAVAAGTSFGQELKYKPIAVKTPDSLTISAQDWGNPTGPEILFIHGFSQSHMSWMRQVDSDLAKEFHIVTYDLRGHGNSDKPLDPAAYRNSKVGAGQYTAATIPDAKLSIYEGIGHSPFYEDAPRFNSELAAFVRTANKAD